MKNSNLHLRKMQIHFILMKKLRSTSKKDVDPFYYYFFKKINLVHADL